MPPELPPSIQNLVGSSPKPHKARDYSNRISLELTQERAKWVLQMFKEKLDGLSKTSPEFAELFVVYKGLRDKIKEEPTNAS